MCVFKVDKTSNVIASEKILSLEAYYKLMNTLLALSVGELDKEAVADEFDTELSNDRSASNLDSGFILMLVRQTLS